MACVSGMPLSAAAGPVLGNIAPIHTVRSSSASPGSARTSHHVVWSGAHRPFRHTLGPAAASPSRHSALFVHTARAALAGRCGAAWPARWARPRSTATPAAALARSATPSEAIAIDLSPRICRSWRTLVSPPIVLLVLPSPVSVTAFASGTRSIGTPTRLSVAGVALICASISPFVAARSACEELVTSARRAPSLRRGLPPLRATRRAPVASPPPSRIAPQDRA